MPQVQLPIFPAGSVEINRDLACRTEEDRVVYYNGHLPVFMHAKNDLASFRLFTSQLIIQGSATQGGHRQGVRGTAGGDQASEQALPEQRCGAI